MAKLTEFEIRASEFEKLGTDPEVWAAAFAKRFALVTTGDFVDTRGVLSAWFHYFAYAVREEKEHAKREREKDLDFIEWINGRPVFRG